MSATKTTFVFAPGGFQGAIHWEPLAKALRDLGYEATTAPIAGVGDDAGTAPPLASVESVHSKVKELVKGEGKDVILLGHSYGGFVASMAVRDCAKSARIALKQPGGVKRVIFLAALVVPEGMTLAPLLEGAELPEWAVFNAEGGYVEAAPECAGMFFNDIEDKEQQQHWAKFFMPTTVKDSVAPVVGSCWDTDVPKTYIHTTKDNPHPHWHQLEMVEPVKRVRPGDWTFETMESDHTPYLSHTEEFATLLDKLAKQAN